MVRLNTIFCSAGRRVELLRAFRDAYAALGIEGRIIALDIDPLAPALRVADTVYMVPRLASPEFLPALLEICRREAPAVLFPLIDHDVPVLSRHRCAIELTGVRVAVVEAAVAEVTEDKWATAQFFSRIGLRTPGTWLPADLPADLEYPLFIKPRRGSAGEHAYKVRGPRQLELFLEYVPDPVVQEFIAGPEITSDVVSDLDGELLGVVCRRRIEVRWGEVAKGVTVHHRELLDACKRVARQLPARGPITVQCLLKNDLPHFTEINARLGGGLPLGIAAGADSPRWLLARAAGVPIDIPALGSYKPDLYITRFDDSWFLDSAQLQL